MCPFHCWVLVLCISIVLVVCSADCTLDTPATRVDSSAVRLEPADRRLDTPGECVDPGTAVDATGRRRRLSSAADPHGDGSADRDGVRRPATQPATVGEIRSRHAESDPGAS